MEKPVAIYDDHFAKRASTFAYRYQGTEKKLSTFSYTYHDDFGEPYEPYLDLEELIERALLHDDVDEFTPLIDEYKSAKDVPEWVLTQMFTLDAVQCFTAALNGQTKSKFCLYGHECFSGCSKPPLLHLAASYASVEITKKLLACGAGAGVDDKCETDFDDMKGLLPLDLALGAAGSGIWIDGWTWRDSIFRLIYSLCRARKRFALEIVRLLAQRTKSVKEELVHSVKNRKLVAVAALLMVAHKRVMPLKLSKEAHGLPLDEVIHIEDLVANEITVLDMLQRRSLYAKLDNELLQKWKDKRLTMKMILLLFGIFERIGDSLGACLQLDPRQTDDKLAAQIAWIFKKAGLPVKDRDIYGVRSKGIGDSPDWINELFDPTRVEPSSFDVFALMGKRDLDEHRIEVPKVQICTDLNASNASLGSMTLTLFFLKLKIKHCVIFNLSLTGRTCTKMLSYDIIKEKFAHADLPVWITALVICQGMGSGFVTLVQ
nr:uncharacterized protein LOC113735339 [Coffea arabica]